MNKTRFPMMIVVGSLVAVALIAILTLQRTTRVQGSGLLKPAGIGDLRQFESKREVPNTGSSAVQEGNRSQASSFGELRRFEAQQLIPDTGAGGVQGGSRSQASGFGDLRRFESQDTVPPASALKNDQPGVGMGDLRRYESGQVLNF